MPPLFADVKNAVCDSAKLSSYVFGLGGRDIFEKDIENVFNELLAGKVSEETRFIGARE
jgi:pyruvate/2-oxoacid:ferredoxin oxidoreductase alpha subunit